MGDLSVKDRGGGGSKRLIKGVYLGICQKTPTKESYIV